MIDGIVGEQLVLLMHQNTLAHVLHRIYGAAGGNQERGARQATYALEYLNLLAVSKFVTGRMTRSK